MESGSLAEWYVEEGGSFVAGDAIAKIETDKVGGENQMIDRLH